MIRYIRAFLFSEDMSLVSLTNVVSRTGPRYLKGYNGVLVRTIDKDAIKSIPSVLAAEFDQDKGLCNKNWKFICSTEAPFGVIDTVACTTNNLDDLECSVLPYKRSSFMVNSMLDSRLGDIGSTDLRFVLPLAIAHVNYAKCMLPFKTRVADPTVFTFE